MVGLSGCAIVLWDRAESRKKDRSGDAVHLSGQAIGTHVHLIQDDNRYKRSQRKKNILRADNVVKVAVVLQ